MTFSPYLAHTDPLFKNLEILPIDKIFIDRIGITMFKVTYELVPKSVKYTRLCIVCVVVDRCLYIHPSGALYYFAY